MPLEGMIRHIRPFIPAGMKLTIIA